MNDCFDIGVAEGLTKIATRTGFRVWLKRPTTTPRQIERADAALRGAARGMPSEPTKRKLDLLSGIKSTRKTMGERFPKPSKSNTRVWNRNYERELKRADTAKAAVEAKRPKRMPLMARLQTAMGLGT